MKIKKILAFISCLTLFIIGIFLIINTNFSKVKADSGWDTDYDYSDSSDWGSSGDSDWGYSSHSYSGSSDSVGGGIYVVLFIIIIVAIIVAMAKDKKGIPLQQIKIFDTISEEEIRKLLPNFNKNEFLSKAYQIFIDVQNYWSEFNYDGLRNNLSDELFNTYKSQLKTLSLKKQKNIMSDFNKLAIDTMRVYKNGDRTTLEVELVVSFYDYVVDNNNNVVRGQKTRKVTNDYILTFISSKPEVANLNKCPNCNAPLDNSASNVCPYCRSTIVSEHYDWILSKKEVKRRIG